AGGVRPEGSGEPRRGAPVDRAALPRGCPDESGPAAVRRGPTGTSSGPGGGRREPAGGAGRGLRDVRRAGRCRPLARGQPGQPPDHVRLPGLLAAVHPPGRGRGPLPGGARPVPARPGLPAGRGPLGRPPDPGAGRLLLRQLRPWAGGRLLPEPGRGHRVAAVAGGVGRRGRGQPFHDRPHPRRRGPAGPAGRRGLRVLPGPDRRLLRAGRAGPDALEGLRRRRGGVGGDRRLLRRRPRAQPGGCSGGREGGGGPVTDLFFDSIAAQPDPYPAVPTPLLELRVSETTGEQVHAIALRCQIRIEPQRRRYPPHEADGLLELFGEPPRWGDTLKPMQFATVSLMVPSFTGSCELDLPVPCTYDFEVAASKYLHALGDGEVPLLLLFSGTVFTKGLSGFSVGQV